MPGRRIFSAMLVAVLFVQPLASAGPESTPRPIEEPFQFKAQSGEIVEAYKGAFQVPENRTAPESRTLTLHYLRFPATGTKSGAPIVYLAGGPGGSGVWFAGSWRFPLFMAMREFGDVVAFDQRGTGASDDTPACKSSQVIDRSTVLSDAAYVKAHQSALRECLDFWEREGVDARGYTTLESVDDLDALRLHLGADKLSLWGISYGSHLALAALKKMDDRIDRVVFTSAEGLDQTVKLPARTDAYFGRLQDAIATQPRAKRELGDIKAMMRRVHASLDKTPLSIQVEADDGSPIDVVFQRRDMQLLASGMIADPNRYAAQLMRVYAALDRGDVAPLISIHQRWLEPDEPISFQLMPVMMDIASGVDADRRTIIEAQAQTALLGQFLNETHYLIDAAPGFDLGDEFRTAPISDTPTLLISGTLDGRTYVKSQQEAVEGLRNRQLVTVRNAGHNLFMVSPEVTHTIQEFMRGEDVSGREIVIDLPSF